MTRARLRARAIPIQGHALSHDSAARACFANSRAISAAPEQTRAASSSSSRVGGCSELGNDRPRAAAIVCIIRSIGSSSLITSHTLYRVWSWHERGKSSLAAYCGDVEPTSETTFSLLGLGAQARSAFLVTDRQASRHGVAGVDPDQCTRSSQMSVMFANVKIGRRCCSRLCWLPASATSRFW